MSQQQPPRPPTRRAPLGEATRRINNAQPSQTKPSSKNPRNPHHEGLRQDESLQKSSAPGSPLSQGDYYPLREFEGMGTSIVVNPRLSAVSRDCTDSNRNSQISTTSTNASDGKRLKSFIGPWKLGKTLGKGATARVRLARHAYTGQEAAIKIVQKKHAQMTQAGSLADLDRAESKVADSGMRRMPVGIEREVAIMKLVQHPNIMKLYDIWENRTEIYLVLEYVDKGELFAHIANKGRLDEEEAFKYFRQILSAVGYCHSFNICHRDLKPENILLTKDLEIKIADFGMAALHQSPDHKLKTSCGSPHYAAPELISGSAYRGDKVDIWSMGIILYALLAGRLPFDFDSFGDEEWMQPLLDKIKIGKYDMAPEFSPEAANLIWRILQVNPRDRISLSQIWKHPVIRKYDYLDDNGGGMSPMSLTLKGCGRPVLRRSDINKELLRHLRSLWHQLSEQDLMDALLSEEPNDQKLFYSLLLRYRDAQLENYIPDIGYSASDYHHVRPLALTKTYSTRNFTQSKGKGHGRQVSRFTVISNVAETEQSYDPFKASRPQHLNAIRAADGAKITIHRTRPSVDDPAVISAHPGTKFRQASRTSVSVISGSDGGRQKKLAAPPGYMSRSSLGSSIRSRHNSPYIRAPIGHKRGVSFSHIRKHSGGSGGTASGPSNFAVRHSNHTEVTDDGGDTLRPIGTPASTRYIRSRKAQAVAAESLLPASRPGRASQIWTEDVRQLSSSLAKDCDEAFNRSSVVSSIDLPSRESTPLSSLRNSGLSKQQSSLAPNVLHKSKRALLDNRPLPPPPVRTDSVALELSEARKQAELRKASGGDESPGYLNRMVSHIDRLMQPISPTNSYVDRRTSSAPVDSRRIMINQPLPSIFEARKEEESPRAPTDLDIFMSQRRHNEAKANRIASAPEPRAMNKNHIQDRFGKSDSDSRDTIRVVLTDSPVKPPAPLVIRKKSSQGGPSIPKSGVSVDDPGSYASRHRQSKLGLRQQYHAGSKSDITPDLRRIDEDQHIEDFANESNSGTIVKKKSIWFKRSSKSGDENDWKMSMGGGNTVPSQSSSNDTARPPADGPLPILPKKKFSLSRLFKKRSSRPNMSLGDNDIFDDNASVEDSLAEDHHISHRGRFSNHEDPKARQIEPQRNWLAKLFNVKPAVRYICFSVSKRRARQELATILREWKRYGIRDLQVDKERNIVFGRVAADNYLEMKEVAFAGEVMTVIEHGKRSPLAIARFTQERGAASSFLKVVDTLENVLKVRGMLIGDERKKRMMVKTLKSA